MHHAGLLQEDVEAGLPAALGLAHIAVTVGCLGEHANPALTCRVLLATVCPFHNLGSFVLGDDALDLQQQIVLVAMAEGAVEEDDLDAGRLQFLQQQVLQRETAGEAVGRQDIEAIKRTGCGLVP